MRTEGQYQRTELLHGFKKLQETLVLFEQLGVCPRDALEVWRSVVVGVNVSVRVGAVICDWVAVWVVVAVAVGGGGVHFGEWGDWEEGGG